ncbi:DUF3348 family protein [Hydrogenophaga sp. BPS33]|uniref:DUF3348 family protein n=1 Tax=Hydrogenophaga sp. BPS33 TaxID=2651974 RepID=UPI00132050A2|nr:DUF3348 family protein [Hydrogenophaga sp. BPS33]QHE84940.1 DUF3348 domain-containing protein [Hydrogenophaga sp. BPS33]
MRSHFNRSALVRQLTGWLPAPEEASRQDLAERLGDWLNVADAITLASAQQNLPKLATASRLERPKPPGDPKADLERARATLAKAIATPPQPPTDASDTEFALHHQRYLDHQRRMEMSIDALRDHVRQVLAARSPKLAQLAAMDAMLDQMLGGREQRLLHGVPAIVKLRFAQLRQSHPDTWPALFEHDLQRTLLAELDLRLQPVMGMVDAFGQEEAGATVLNSIP